MIHFNQAFFFFFFFKWIHGLGGDSSRTKFGLNANCVKTVVEQIPLPCLVCIIRASHLLEPPLLRLEPPPMSTGASSSTSPRSLSLSDGFFFSELYNFFSYVSNYLFCFCWIFCSQYLTQLLAEHQKLGPFMQVLPICNRLLNQGLTLFSFFSFLDL